MNARSIFFRRALPGLLVVLASVLLTGCAALQQLDAWSRGTKTYVDSRDIGAKGLPASVTRSKNFVDRFILWSEIPVKEFYGLPYHTSRD